VAGAILQTAEEHESDLILMGSYGPHPLLEAVRDSTVNYVLPRQRPPSPRPTKPRTPSR
jgi:nucleotide-binding universal stress UspA family protein